MARGGGKEERKTEENETHLAGGAGARGLRKGKIRYRCKQSGHAPCLWL